MIVAENITKSFEGFKALENLNCVIPKGSIYGLVGSNGAGKSTFLRLATGIYSPDKGSGGISIDGEPVWENPKGKGKFVFLPDELFFLGQTNLKRMAKFYQSFYKDFSMERFNLLTETFKLNPKKNLSGFSKGMKRQGAMILALCSGTEYLFFDETFDGLDPVMRNLVKNLIHEDVSLRGTTVVITYPLMGSLYGRIQKERGSLFSFQMSCSFWGKLILGEWPSFISPFTRILAWNVLTF